MKRSRLTRKTRLERGQPLQRKTRLRPVSKKQKSANALYAPLRLKFLEERPTCQKCNAARSSDVHHRKGRGRFLLAVETWSALCRICHREVHENRRASRREGWIL